MAARALASDMASTAQFVTLGVDAETFAVPVTRVQEILDLQPVARLPHAPRFLLGLVDVRGQTVPVVDLRARLGLPPAEATEHSRILVLKVVVGGRDLVVGLLADRVFEVTALEELSADGPPEFGLRWDSAYIAGIGRRRDGFVIVLDLSHLLASAEAPLIEAVHA